jgi:arylsulfatase A-like enzyme
MSQPNILVLTSHDTGRHIGPYGVKTVHTPALDALAADGVRFDQYFTTSPVCSPARGAMLTGRYPQSNGLMGLTHDPWDWTLNAGERHLSHILRDAGYHTALFGIQHETERGAELGFAERHLERGQGQRHPAGEVAAAAAAFLTGEAAARAPFYTQVGFFETHRPFDYGGVELDDSLGVFVPPYLQANDAARAQLAHLQGAVRTLDNAVGAILAALDASGLAENTIVIYTTDHGIEFPRAKWFLYDAGIAVALLMRWPGGGITGGRVCDWLLSNVDFVPTLLDLAGVPIPGNVEGRSFAAWFAGEAAPPPRDAVFAMFQGANNESRCIRTRDAKLIRTFTPRRRHELPIDIANVVQRVRCPTVELFDLARDPNEFTDVGGDPAYAAVRADLSARLWAWLEAVNDPVLRGPVPTPYYQEAIAEYTAQQAASGK